MPKITNYHWAMDWQPAKTAPTTSLMQHLNLKNPHNQNRQTTDILRRTCAKGCPQHTFKASHIITRATYRQQQVWSGSTTTPAHHNGSNWALTHHNMQKEQPSSSSSSILQIATTHNIKELLICTDYARLSFTCHIHGWKQNGFKTINLSSIKISSKPATTLSRNTTCYWKKFRGHSWQPGQDNSDQTDALAKAGALHGDPWTFEPLPPSPSVSVITCHQHARAV